MNSLFQDLRYGWRTLSKSPGFAAVAVITLAMGIGANSTIFSWINSTLLHPIPGAQTGNMIAITRSGSQDLEHFFSYPDYADLRDHSQSITGMMAATINQMDITGSGQPERVWGSLVSTNYFEVLGVEPVLGRGFTPDEERKLGAVPVAVISYGLWQSHFGGSRSAVGATIRINQHPYTIVGIAPADFQGGQTGLRSQLWIPLAMLRDFVINGGDDIFHDRADPWLLPYARLKPGVSEQQAREELNLLMQQIAQQYPDSHRARSDVEVAPLWRARFGANYYFYLLLPVLLGTAGVVLLLACANVANLLLVRSVSRRREIAIRLAIGASRWRLVRQLMVESLLLAFMGGCVAMLVTVWSSQLLTRFFPPSNLPIFLDVRTDRAVLLATGVIALLAGLMFGVLPALRSSNLMPVTVLKEEAGSASGGPRKAWLSSALVVLQLALSVLLLVCAGLFVRTFEKQQKFDIGFNPDHVLLASYELFPQGYDQERGQEFNRKLLSKLETLPGIQSVTLANWIPLGFFFRSDNVQPEGYTPQPHESTLIPGASIGPNYFRTMQIPLLAGREFTAEDTETTQRVAIVNEAMAGRYWPGQNAIGKRLYVNSDHAGFSVVGVTRNSSYQSLRDADQPFFYLPLFQSYANGLVIHARTAGEPMALAPLVEKTVHEFNPNLPVFDVGTLYDHVQTVNINSRIAGASAGAFGLLALLLAAVGIYAVIAYTARQRTREIGIRMAIGAQASDIRLLVLGQGLRLTAIGLAVGIAAALAITRLLKSLLFEVSSTDALTFISAALLLCLVALTACYIPARRAMKVDPVIALRQE